MIRQVHVPVAGKRGLGGEGDISANQKAKSKLNGMILPHGFHEVSILPEELKNMNLHKDSLIVKLPSHIKLESSRQLSEKITIVDVRKELERRNMNFKAMQAQGMVGGKAVNAFAGKRNLETLNLKYLYSGDVLFHVEWCIRLTAGSGVLQPYSVASLVSHITCQSPY